MTWFDTYFVALLIIVPLSLFIIVTAYYARKHEKKAASDKRKKEIIEQKKQNIEGETVYTWKVMYSLGFRILSITVLGTAAIVLIVITYFVIRYAKGWGDTIFNCLELLLTMVSVVYGLVKVNSPKTYTITKVGLWSGTEWVLRFFDEEELQLFFWTQVEKAEVKRKKMFFYIRPLIKQKDSDSEPQPDLKKKLIKVKVKLPPDDSTLEDLFRKFIGSESHCEEPTGDAAIS